MTTLLQVGVNRACSSLIIKKSSECSASEILSLVYLQIRDRFKSRMNAVLPAPNNGYPPKKSSRVNASDVSAVRAVRVQSCSEFELK